MDKALTLEVKQLLLPITRKEQTKFQLLGEKGMIRETRIKINKVKLKSVYILELRE